MTFLVPTSSACHELTGGRGKKKKVAKPQKRLKEKLRCWCCCRSCSNSISSLYFEEIRDHILYATLCNCNFVELLKNGAQ